MQYTTSGIKKFTKNNFRIWFSAQGDISDQSKISDRFKIIFIESGSCILKIKNDKTALISPSIILLDQNSGIELINKDKLNIKILAFHPGFLNSKFDFENIKNSKDIFSFSEQQDIYLLDLFLKNEIKTFNNIGFDYKNKIVSFLSNIEIALTVQEQECWPCHARCGIIELLFFIKNSLNNTDNDLIIGNKILIRENSSDENKFDINNVIMFLHLNYYKKISINILSEQFYTNRTTLSNKFKKATGMPLVNYLSKLRVQIASSLLQNSALNIFEIMNKVGYSDASYFLKIFKKYTGLTPSHYRKINTWIKK